MERPFKMSQDLGECFLVNVSMKETFCTLENLSQQHSTFSDTLELVETKRTFPEPLQILGDPWRSLQKLGEPQRNVANLCVHLSQTLANWRMLQLPILVRPCRSPQICVQAFPSVETCVELSQPFRIPKILSESLRTI